MRKAAVFLSTVLILLGTGACARQEEQPASTARTVPPEYAFLYEGAVADAELPLLWKSLPYESISLQRQGCFGICPTYEVTLRKGGEASYTGYEFVERERAWVGRIDIHAYARLCYLLDEMEFGGLESRYAAGWPDEETVVVTVTHSTSRAPVTVTEYGGFGPPRLWAIELAIDGVVGAIGWTQQE